MKLCQNILCQTGQIDRHRPELGARHLGKFQQVVDQLCHALRGAAYVVQEGAAFQGKQIAVILQHCLAVPIDTAQWRLQIVRD